MNTTSTPRAETTDALIARHGEDLMAQVALLTGLATAAVSPECIDGAHHVILPPGYQRLDITEAVQRVQPTPPRKSGTMRLKSLGALQQYLADQAAQAGTIVYADPDTTTFTAVFNDHRVGPGWRDHRAVFKAELTPELQTWLGANKKAMSQTEFAEFIEDNLADITEPAAQQLLDVATTIQAKTNIAFSSAKRLHDGQVQMGYTETIEASAGASGALQIPREFNLGLRIFKNGDGFKLRARLKYRLGSGAVKFWYELDRPERAIETAFGDYIKTLSESSGYLVLLGTP